MVTTEAQFYSTYEDLAEDGDCDCAGGAEYQRVLSEWIAAGRPEPHEAFIRRRANPAPDELAEIEKYTVENIDPLIEEVSAEMVEAARDDAASEDESSEKS